MSMLQYNHEDVNRIFVQTNKFILRRKKSKWKKKNQDRTCAEADHCHHRRYPVRPVPSGRLLSLCCNPFRIFQYLSEIRYPADDPCLCDHGYCRSFTGCREASPDHSGSGLWLHSDHPIWYHPACSRTL